MRHRVKHATTFGLMSVPFAVFFAIVWLVYLRMLARGIQTANGKAILVGTFVTVVGSPILFVSIRNAWVSLKIWRGANRQRQARRKDGNGTE